MTLKKTLATLVAGTMLTSLTGCYSITVQASDVSKPVSVSHSIGRRATPDRSFKTETVSWWLLGLVGLFSVPGGVSFSTPPDKITSEVVEAELRKGGKGVVDLKVTSQNDVMSFALGVVAGIIPVVGALFRPMSVIVEGKVVE